MKGEQVRDPIRKSRNRNTGTTVELWDEEFFVSAQTPDNGEGRWWLLCTDHDKSFAFTGQRAARDYFSHPEVWCAGCKGSPVDLTPGKTARWSRQQTTTQTSSVTEQEHAVVHHDIEPGRKEQYGNLNKGDFVKIKGESGTFQVAYVDTYEDVKRPPEVTVIGGFNGRSSWRTFVLTRCTPKSKRGQS